MKRIAHYFPTLCILTCLVGLFLYYLTAMPHHMMWQEQNQIFLASQDWLATYFNKPAWLGCMAAEWLIQFFCIPWAAALILTLAIAGASSAFCSALSDLINRRFAAVISILICVWLIFTTFNEKSSLPFILCLTGGAVLSLAEISIITGRKNKYSCFPLFVVLAYWMFGVGAVVTLVFACWRAIKTGARYALIFSLVAIGFGIACPVLLASRYSLPVSKAALYPGIPYVSLPEKERRLRLAIDNAYYHDDLEEAKRLALQAEPNDITAFYYYLASARQDSLPDNLLKYPVKYLGTLTTIGDTTPLPVINIMNDLYYSLGDMTYAERAAMMRNVFSPQNRNSRMIRRLAEINLVSGDTLAAMKYLRILDGVFSQHRWSRDHTPGHMTAEAQADIARRRLNLNRMPDLRTGDNCRFILLQLLESNHHNTIALDYLLCTDLLLKDIETFKNDYDTYCMATDSPRYKDLYQQALMIYLAGTDAPQEEWQKYITSKEQFERFRAYNLRRGDRAFADTYWYYFDMQQ